MNDHDPADLPDAFDDGYDDEPLTPSLPPEPAGPAATFVGGGGGLSALDDPAPLGRDDALQKLGRPPFDRSARSKFRLLGFLATVYEHVADDLKHANTPPETPDAGS